MLEFMICATLTILPDYLIKHYFFGRRWGKEITFFSMWFELRWGITLCIVSTVLLITTLFYFHPSTTNASPFFRTVAIMPEKSGRVSEVYVKSYDIVQAGDPLFSLEDTSQRAAVEAAKAQVEEARAQFATAKADLAQAEGQVATAQGKVDQALFDLKAVRDAVKINVDLVSGRQIERVENQVAEAQGSLESAKANRDAVVARLETVLPAQLNSAKEALAQATAELDKTVVYASIAGQLVQFVLQKGDIVNPMIRSAGVLVPTEAFGSGRKAVQAGFNQLAAPVVKPGTIAEITCLSKPFTVVPMVITRVQPLIAAGQIRTSDQLLEIEDRAKPGTIAVVMEPLYENGMEGIVPGTKCIANAYTSNHELLASGDLSTSETIFYHIVDTIALVHAAILRIQALMIPVRTLVFDSH